MATDVLILGGVTFDAFSTPQRMGFGGKQMLAVHTLPGGRRQIDVLGPNDDNLTWHGQFFGDGAYAKALLLDSLRRQGVRLPLSFAGQAHMVVIEHFRAEIERLPMAVSYSISCVIASGGVGGVSANVGAAQLAAADLAAAAAI
jgi:hypothetical protein